MSSPKSIEELTKHIEQAVEAYMDAGRKAALEAVEQALSSGSKKAGAPSGRSKATKATKTKSKARKNGPRRTPEKLAELKRQLDVAVRGQPGRSMVELASEVGASVRELHHPMTVLKREDRVRTVGRKQHMRYFPALVSGDEAVADAA